MKKIVLILIDIQKEYVTPGRPFFLKGIESSLQNCRNLLNLARQKSWDIVHVRHSNGDQAERFNPRTNYFDFVEGFEPLENERSFIKNDFSCYSSPEFSSYMSMLKQSGEDNEVYAIGYNTVMCCLSTLEEARRKKDKISLVKDASYAKAIGDKDESEMHDTMLDIYKTKGLTALKTTEELIAQHSFTLNKGEELSVSNVSHSLLFK